MIHFSHLHSFLKLSSSYAFSHVADSGLDSQAVHLPPAGVRDLQVCFSLLLKI